MTLLQKRAGGLALLVVAALYGGVAGNLAMRRLFVAEEGGVGFARADFCPAHKGHEPRWFVEKTEREATAKAERLAAREARKAARTAAKAEAQPRD